LALVFVSTEEDGLAAGGDGRTKGEPTVRRTSCVVSGSKSTMSHSDSAYSNNREVSAGMQYIYWWPQKCAPETRAHAVKLAAACCEDLCSRCGVQLCGRWRGLLCNSVLCVFKCCLRSILMQPTGRPELEA
jgi:hypothetical protein